MLRFREWRDKYLKEEKTDEEKTEIDSISTTRRIEARADKDCPGKPDKPFRRDENRDSDVHIES
jgi:hypothetical protein